MCANECVHVSMSMCRCVYECVHVPVHMSGCVSLCVWLCRILPAVTSVQAELVITKAKNYAIFGVSQA